MVEITRLETAKLFHRTLVETKKEKLDSLNKPIDIEELSCEEKRIVSNVMAHGLLGVSKENKFLPHEKITQLEALSGLSELCRITRNVTVVPNKKYRRKYDPKGLKLKYQPRDNKNA